METIQFPLFYSRTYDRCDDQYGVCVYAACVTMIYPLRNSQCGDRCKTIYAEQ